MHFLLISENEFFREINVAEWQVSRNSWIMLLPKFSVKQLGVELMPWHAIRAEQLAVSFIIPFSGSLGPHGYPCMLIEIWLEIPIISATLIFERRNELKIVKSAKVYVERLTRLPFLKLYCRCEKISWRTKNDWCFN